MDKAAFLSVVSLFSQMTEEDLKRIAEHARIEQFQQDELIIREGERDSRLFVVISGRVEVVKRLGQRDEKILGAFGPRSYFGEMAMIDDLARSASVISRESTQVLSLEQTDLRNKIVAYPTIALELLQTMSRRLRAAEKFLVNTLGSFLPICASCKKIREKDGSWVSIEAYISDRSETEFSHGICPDCAKRLYPEFYTEE